MTVIADKNGNLFNAEMVLTYEHDISEVKVLGRVLLEQRNELYYCLSSLLDDLRDKHHISLSNTVGASTRARLENSIKTLAKARGES